ncbi:MAG: GumC family protein [Acetobacteraceae bacterium]
MSGTISLPPNLVLRDILLSAFNCRRLILFMTLAIMTLSAQIAYQVEPGYKAHSTLLVLLGTEHAYRPAAGQQFMNTGGVDAEQVLRTEASILSSVDLHRSVIREIGLARLYPKLLEPPGLLSRWYTDAKTWVSQTTGLTEIARTDPIADDPMMRALEKFASNLAIAVDKKTSVITLTFTNPNRELSAEVLRVLEERYFTLRSTLYGDVQAPIVRLRLDAVGKQLAEADQTLATFKRDHDIGSFADRRQILMRQQGDLEASLAKAESAIAEHQARLTQLNQQLAAASGARRGGTPSASAPLQGMVDTYRRREQEAQTRYRGSPAVDEARRQQLERETDIARMQATQAFSVQTDRNKAEAELQAGLAGRDTIKAQLAALTGQIDALNAEELELQRLERNRGILEDNYKAVAKILDERQVIETVDANRQSSVRVVQPPTAPALPQPIRRLILIAGAVVSVLLAIGITLMSHFFRSSYLRPEALEFDTGLAVLATVPEMKSLGRSSALVVRG